MPILDLPSLHIDDAAAATLPVVALTQLMGEADPGNLSAAVANWLVGRDLLYTISVMCDPDHLQNADDELVGPLHDALNAAEISATSEILSEVEGLMDVVDVDVVLKGAANPRLAAILAVATREDPGHIIEELLSTDWLAHIAAGYILRWIVSRWRDPLAKSEASLKKAAAVTEQWCKSHGIKGGGEQNITRNMWPKYKSASHLWAAFYMMKDAEIDISTKDGFVSFCSTAQWLLEEGSKIIPKGRRAGETILRLDEAWSVPASHVRRAIYKATGEDAGIVAIWSNELGVHDIRETGRPPFKQV
jgi:hypothetical protein